MCKGKWGQVSQNFHFFQPLLSFRNDMKNIQNFYLIGCFRLPMIIYLQSPGAYTRFFM